MSEAGRGWVAERLVYDLDPTGAYVMHDMITFHRLRVRDQIRKPGYNVKWCQGPGQPGSSSRFRL